MLTTYQLYTIIIYVCLVLGVACGWGYFAIAMIAYVGREDIVDK